MTYCLAISTADGLVFCSDSRTNAGPDMLSSYSKMRILSPGDDRVFSILASGNLATTQAVFNRLEQDLEAVVQERQSRDERKHHEDHADVNATG